MIEWQKTEVKNLFELKRGYAFKSKDYIEENKKNSTFVLRVSNIDNDGSITTTNAKYVPESFNQEFKDYLLEKDDILLVMVGATTGKIGKVEESVLPALLNQNMWNLKPKLNVITKNFAYYLIVYNIDKFISTKHGSARPFINQSDFKQFALNVPVLLEEQQKIAAILSSVDEAIEKTEQIIEQTERVKKGLMQELLTKGIGHTEFKDSPVGKIPQGWEIAIFKDVFDRITTKNSVDNQNVLTISGEHGLISQLEYFNKSVSAKSLTNYTYLENGDFAYNKSYSNGYPLGAIKRLEMYEAGVVSTLYICFRLKAPNINGFYKYYFDSPYWHRQVYSIAPEGGRSHGLLNVGVKDFFEILIPVPPVEEQMMIERKLASIDEKVIIEKDKLNNLQTLKQGLMQELLTGKKRVKVADGEEVLS